MKFVRARDLPTKEDLLMLTIKPLGHHSLAADFLKSYKKSIKETMFMERQSPSRILNLRPSQMPVCPMNTFITRAMYGIYTPVEFGMAYYTRVGTVVHEVLQQFLCQSGKYLADYYCHECNTWHRMSYKWECCGFPCEYHELTINYKGIVGHIDAVYKDDQGRLWILDFKTTSTEQAPKKKNDPGIVYREQVEAYAVLFELQYGKKIHGFADAFVVRNNPMKQDPVTFCERLTDDKRREVKRRLGRYKKMHRATLDANTKSEALALFNWGRCADPWCRTCMIRDDKMLKRKLVEAYRMGTRKNNLPVRELAEREQLRLDALKAKSATGR